MGFLGSGLPTVGRRLHNVNPDDFDIRSRTTLAKFSSLAHTVADVAYGEAAVYGYRPDAGRISCAAVEKAANDCTIR